MNRPNRREVVDLAAWRRRKSRPKPPWGTSVRGVPLVIFAPFHLDVHEPELEIPVGFDEIVCPELPPGSTWDRLAVLHEALANDVHAELVEGELPVVVSGCCTTALGTVAGMQRAGIEPSIIWFDAHGDLQTPETSGSGYPGGMVLRQLVGGADRTVPEQLELRPVPERNVVLVDARDLDPPEAEFLATSEIRHVTAAEMPALRLPPGPFYLHIDLDVLSPQHVPGARFPVPGGPEPEVVRTAMRAVLATGQVAAMGLACTYRSDIRPTAAVREIGGLAVR